MEELKLSENIERTIKESLPNKNICSDLANFYSLFSDSTRIKIIISLLLSEMCVNDLSRIVGVNQTTISHQLKILKSNGAVTSTRKNKFIFYKITDKFVSIIMHNGVDYILSKQTKRA